MRTYFVLHGLTERNIDENAFDAELAKLGYDESKLTPEQLPSKVDIAQGQIDEPLNIKGKFLARFYAAQLNDRNADIQTIYCANQIRCKQTAEIIAKHLNKPCKIVVDDRINARSYGIIAEQKMDTDKLKHFWKYKMDTHTLKTIALYLLAPEQLGAEKKSDFRERINSFLQDNKENLDNALIVAGSDMWKEIQEQNYFYAYKGESNYKLKRGQVALVNFELQKNKNLQNAGLKKIKNLEFPKHNVGYIEYFHEGARQTSVVLISTDHKQFYLFSNGITYNIDNPKHETSFDTIFPFEGNPVKLSQGQDTEFFEESKATFYSEPQNYVYDNPVVKQNTSDFNHAKKPLNPYEGKFPDLCPKTKPVKYKEIMDVQFYLNKINAKQIKIDQFETKQKEESEEYSRKYYEKLMQEEKIRLERMDDMFFNK